MRFLIAAIAVLVLCVLGWSSFGGGALGVLSSMLMARTMPSTEWRVRATLQLRAFGTAPLTQKPTSAAFSAAD